VYGTRRSCDLPDLPRRFSAALAKWRIENSKTMSFQDPSKMDGRPCLGTFFLFAVDGVDAFDNGLYSSATVRNHRGISGPSKPTGRHVHHSILDGVHASLGLDRIEDI